MAPHWPLRTCLYPRFASHFETLSAPLRLFCCPCWGRFPRPVSPPRDQVPATLKATTGLDDRALRLCCRWRAACLAAPSPGSSSVHHRLRPLSGTWVLWRQHGVRGPGLFPLGHTEQSISQRPTAGETGISEITVNYTCRPLPPVHERAEHRQDLKVSLPDDLSEAAILPAPLLRPRRSRRSPMPDEPPRLTTSWCSRATTLAGCSPPPELCPYSQGGTAAVALQFEDGRIFCGRYAENAAFNPEPAADADGLRPTRCWVARSRHRAPRRCWRARMARSASGTPPSPPEGAGFSRGLSTKPSDPGVRQQEGELRLPSCSLRLSSLPFLCASGATLHQMPLPMCEGGLPPMTLLADLLCGGEAQLKRPRPTLPLCDPVKSQDAFAWYWDPAFPWFCKYLSLPFPMRGGMAAAGNVGKGHACPCPLAAPVCDPKTHLLPPLGILPP